MILHTLQVKSQVRTVILKQVMSNNTQFSSSSLYMYHRKLKQKEFFKYFDYFLK